MRRTGGSNKVPADAGFEINGFIGQRSNQHEIIYKYIPNNNIEESWGTVNLKLHNMLLDFLFLFNMTLKIDKPG